MNNILKVGILGGAFNPPHQNHIEVAKLALQVCDQIWMMVCYDHTHGKKMVEGHHRMYMTKLAIGKNEKIIEDNFEIIAEEKNGTYEALKHLKNIYLHYPFEFYLIIGQDNANTINTWRNWEKLIKNIPFIVIQRKPYEDAAEWCRKPPHQIIKSDLSEVSSTGIRQQLAEGKEPEHLHPDVLKYIKENKLYASV